jgi:hypothetical protein
MLQRTLPAGFIAPCLPTKIDKLPSGSQWLHEIKHDGFRIIARKNGAQVRLFGRPGNDLTRRFPQTLARLRSRSCIIEGEAVASDDNGVAPFDLVRLRRSPAPSWALDCRACYWRAVVFWAGGDVDVNPPDLAGSPITDTARFDRPTPTALLRFAPARWRLADLIEHPRDQLRRDPARHHAAKYAL